MLSSWQIAAMHAQQNQAFGAQQAYSQQLSASMPSPYQGYGLSATGMGGGFGQGPGFGYNYGAGAANSYGPGNSFGNTATSMIGGIGSAIGGSMAFTGGLMGFKAGGLSGGLMGFAGGGLLGAGISHVANSFMEGAHESAAIERTLSQFQFQNAASRTGHGFTRTDSSAVTSMVRQMERIPDMLTSFGELNRIMDKMGQMGLMQGVRDVGDFMRKFRESVSTLKDMSKMMGTTMEGALQAFGEARASGFYANNDIMRNALNRQITGSLTGMNQGQVGALQQFGSQLGHAMGGSRKTGAQFALRTAGQLGMANQMGILTNDQIMEMTGKEGAAGIEDLSGQMTQLGYKMGYSNVGQALTLALGEVKNGRYTGNMDQELVERVRKGELGLDELKSLARSKAGSRGAKLSFAAHKERLRSEMVGSVGTEGIAMQLQSILGDRGWSNPDAVNLVMQRFGASEEQANLLQQMMPDLQNIGSQMNLASKQETKNAARNAAMREHGWDAIKHRITKKIEHYTTDWAKDLGSSVRDYFQNWADDFMDDLTGQYREYVTKRVADTFKYSMGGVGAARTSLSEMVQRAGKVNSGLGSSRMDVGSSGGLSGAAARLGHFIGGGTTQGERAIEVLSGLDRGDALLRGYSTSDLVDNGAIVLDSSYWSGKGVGTTQTKVENAMERFRRLGTAEGGLKEWQKTLAVTNLTGDGPSAEQLLRDAYRRAAQRGDISLETDPSKKVDLIWEDMMGTLKSSDRGEQLVNQLNSGTSKVNVIAAVQAAEKQSGRAYRIGVDFDAMGQGILGNIDVKNQAQVGREIESMNKSLSKAFGGSDTQASWAEMKKLIDSGSQLGKLLVGNQKYGGIAYNSFMSNDKELTAKGGGTWDQRSGKALRDMLARGNLNDEDRKMLAELGVDADKLQEEINKDPAAIDRLLSATGSGGISISELLKYQGLTEASGLNKITTDMNKEGRALTSRLTGDSYKTSRAKYGKTGEGAQISMMMAAQAAQLSGVNAENADKYTDLTSQIAGRIAGLKDKGARDYFLEVGGDELRDTYNYRQGLSKKLRSGQGADDILGAAGIRLGSSDQDLQFRKQLEGMLGGNKKLDEKEREAVIQLLTSTHAGGLRSKEGVSANSTQMSDADVAKTFQTMSENNVKVATILDKLNDKVGGTSS